MCCFCLQRYKAFNSPPVSSHRSLEESQAERRYASQGQGDLENVLFRLDFTHTSEELLQAEVTRLEGRQVITYISETLKLLETIFNHRVDKVS